MSDPPAHLGALASVSIDVDGLRHYHAIHGLPAPPSDGGDVVIERGLRRFLDVCERHGIAATLFVVGTDLAGDGVASLVAKAARAGHEIASHSYAHRYDLSLLAPAEIEADLARANDAVAHVTGARPRGFRAPGYNVSEALFDALDKLGFAYDSSVMPSPAYWGARRAAQHAYALRARFTTGNARHASASIAGTAADFVLAPRDPYWPRRGRRAARARSHDEARAFVELPIATGAGGMPFLGTTLVALPEPAAMAQTAAALLRSPRAPVVLELRAIDFVDDIDIDDSGGALAEHQRDLRVPVRKKLARVEIALRMLARTRELVTLASIAAATVAGADAGSGSA